jgi:hypothetical protein
MFCKEKTITRVINANKNVEGKKQKFIGASSSNEKENDHLT